MPSRIAFARTHDTAAVALSFITSPIWPVSRSSPLPGFTTKDTGSGVGLAIAERVVSAHHGRIAIDSEEGRGTTITITLPTDQHGLAALPRWTSAEPA